MFRLLSLVCVVTVAASSVSAFSPSVVGHSQRYLSHHRDLHHGHHNMIPEPSLELESAMAQLDACWQAFPYTAAAVICGVKASAADLIAQSSLTTSPEDSVESSTVMATATEESSSFLPVSYDAKRNFAFLLYGSLYQGIAHEYIFNHLYPVWFGTGTEVSVVLMKVAFNLLVQTTLVTLPFAYILKATICSDSLTGALDKYVLDIQEQGLLTKCFLLWGPTQCLTFSVVPEHWRVTFIAVVSFFWLIALSSISSKDVSSSSDAAMSVDADDSMMAVHGRQAPSKSALAAFKSRST